MRIKTIKRAKPRQDWAFIRVGIACTFKFGSTAYGKVGMDVDDTDKKK